MAETNEKPPVDDRPHLDANEKAYFDSRGQTEVPLTEAKPETAPETVPETHPKPETPSAEAKPDTPPSIPVATLQEERKRRQDAEERARQMELLNARMEERFRAFRDAVAPRQQQPQAPPEVDRDIFGAVKHMQQEQQRTRGEIENYKRQIQQEDYMKQLKQWGSDAEAAFVRQNPDYYEALTTLRQARAKELQVWGMSPSAIGQQLSHEENQLLARAAAERRNPAEMAYSLAIQRGHRKGAAPAQQPTSLAGRHEVDLNRVEAGQRQSSSLSNVGGGAGGRDVGDVEITDLLKMNDREFGAWIEKHPGRFRQLKGGAH